VLGLAEQVDRNHEWIGLVVGDHQDLRRAGEQVNTHLTEQLPFGLGDIGVPRAGDEVDPADALRAQGQRDDGLDPAEHVDLVCAGHRHRGDGGRRDHAADGRGACRDPLDAGDLRGHDRHVGRGGQRVTATRDVGPGGVDRDVLLPQDDAGHGLDLEVRQRFPLPGRKPTDVRLHGDDVVDDLLGQRSDQRDDLVLVEAKALRGPLVEFF